MDSRFAFVELKRNNNVVDTQLWNWSNLSWQTSLTVSSGTITFIVEPRFSPSVADDRDATVN